MVSLSAEVESSTIILRLRINAVQFHAEEVSLHSIDHLLVLDVRHLKSIYGELRHLLDLRNDFVFPVSLSVCQFLALLLVLELLLVFFVLSYYRPKQSKVVAHSFVHSTDHIGYLVHLVLDGVDQLVGVFNALDVLLLLGSGSLVFILSFFRFFW